MADQTGQTEGDDDDRIEEEALKVMISNKTEYQL